MFYVKCFHNVVADEFYHSVFSLSLDPNDIPSIVRLQETDSKLFPLRDGIVFFIFRQLTCALKRFDISPTSFCACTPLEVALRRPSWHAHSCVKESLILIKARCI